MQIDKLKVYGREAFLSHVSTFKMNYSYTHTTQDLIPVIDLGTNKVRVFANQDDQDDRERGQFSFSPNLYATAVTINPLTWKSQIAMRFSMRGCEAVSK